MYDLKSHHAHLWIGKHEHLITEAIKALQTLWCERGGCGTCPLCNRLREKHHHNLLWLAPAKQTYTVDQIDELHHALTFQLEPDEHFVVVLESAQALSPASSNKLLKSLEEPAPGYHFLLLSESRFALLPTIVSRCLIIQLGSEHIDDGALLHFIGRLLSDDFDLQYAMQQVAALNIDESKTKTVIDLLLQQLMERYKEYLVAGDDAYAQHAQELIAILHKAYTQLPMPGSTNSFWRTLFLKMQCMKKN